jgi:hypothetical protein
MFLLRHLVASFALVLVCQDLAADELSRFVDPETGIEISYPSYWMLEETVEDGEVFTVNVNDSTDGGRCVIFIEEERVFDGMTDSEAVDFLFESNWYENRYWKWFPSFVTVKRTRSEISGRIALEIQHQIDLSDIGLNAQSESIDYVIARDGELVTLGCFAGLQEFPYLHAVFIETLKSTVLPAD